MDEDLDAAIEYLLNLGYVDETRIFSGPGFCFGGDQALELSKRRAFVGTVTLYGPSIADLQDPTSDNWGLLGVDGTPILGIYGEQDVIPSAEQAKGFQQAMEDRGMTHTVTIYEGVSHGFVNPQTHQNGLEQAVSAWAIVSVYALAALCIARLRTPFMPAVSIPEK